MIKMKRKMVFLSVIMIMVAVVVLLYTMMVSGESTITDATLVKQEEIFGDWQI